MTPAQEIFRDKFSSSIVQMRKLRYKEMKRVKLGITWELLLLLLLVLRALNPWMTGASAILVCTLQDILMAQYISLTLGDREPV